MIRAFIISFLLLLTSLYGYCCSCDYQSFEDAIKHSDEIFLGRIIEMKEVKTVYDEEDGYPYTRMWSAKFEVEKKWKGSNDKYVTVYQPNTSCDFLFEFPSHPYLVYARNGELFLWDSTESFTGLDTWLCSRTAGAEIYYGWINDSLGDDRPLLDKAFPNHIDLRSNYYDWIIGIIGGIVIIGMVAWILKY